MTTPANSTENQSAQSEALLPMLIQRAKTSPSLLKPADVIHLQRSLGNNAVLQLMRTATTELPAAAPADAPLHQPHEQAGSLKISRHTASAIDRAIQRLIGFEIETRIPLYKDDGTGTLEKPDYDEVHSDAGTGDASEISVDKDADNSIIELVTPPVDDSQISKNFKRTAQNWVLSLTKLHAAASTTPVKKMNTTISSADDDLHFGFDVGDSMEKKDKVAIQATHGIRLDKVGELFKKSSIPDANQARGADKLKSEAVAEVGPIMEGLMPKLSAIVDPTAAIPNKTARTQAIKELNGFLALLTQYLVSGGKNKTYYLKNHTMLFYKSKMSDVRNNLVAANAYADQLFNGTNRGAVITQMLTDTGRTGADPLFMIKAGGSNISCDDWLEEVLSGTDDHLFEEAKNPWGTDIKPGKVKNKLAAVLEHRNMVQEFKPDDNMDLNHPDLIVDYLLQFFKRNKKMQDIHHG